MNSTPGGLTIANLVRIGEQARGVGENLVKLKADNLSDAQLLPRFNKLHDRIKVHLREPKV